MQFALITSTLLIAASYCNAQYSQTADQIESNQELLVEAEEYYNQEKQPSKARAKNRVDDLKKSISEGQIELPRFAITGLFLYFLWACCLGFWINYLRTIVSFSISIPVEEISSRQK